MDNLCFSLGTVAMHKLKVACPLCSNDFAIADASCVGTSVHCRNCGAPFTIATGDLRQACATQLTSGPAKTTEQSVDDQPWWVQSKEPLPQPGPATEVVPQKKPVAPKAALGLPSPESPPLFYASQRFLVVGAIVAAFMLLLGVSAAVAVVCFIPGSIQEAVAHVSADPEPMDRSTPTPNFVVKQKNPVDSDFDESLVPQPPPVNPQPPQMGEQPNPQAQPDPKGPLKEPLPREPGALASIANNHGVTAAQQKKIDGAIARGVKFLKEEQSKDGSWLGYVSGHKNFFLGHGAFPLGPTALAGLTLLECGVPATDPQITKAASFIRKHWQEDRHTYELSLILLFLDKLGDKKDNSIIKSVALRLVSGQTQNGGWSYSCPVLTKDQEAKIYTALNKDRPKLPTAVDRDNTPWLAIPLDRSYKPQIPIPVDKDEKPPLPSPTQKSTYSPPTNPPKNHDFDECPDAGDECRAENDTPLVAQQPPGKRPMLSKLVSPNGVIDDNSNTQFAMLALWAAHRHDLPVEKVLALSELRFRVSQLPGGAWAYRFHDEKPKASMTCVGLLGLALGKGITADTGMRNKKLIDHLAQAGKAANFDDQIHKGLDALPLESGTIDYQNSLYFVWSVERIGVLYDLTKIAGRDWYQWGVAMLLPTQRGNGCWETHSYIGSSATLDTCFALLFLKRANLAQDFTDLNLFQAIPTQNMAMPKN
jgi:hypothetical protein